MFCSPIALTMPLGVSHMRGAGVAGHGLRGKSFHHDTAQAIQIDELGEFDAVAEGPARGNDWIFEMDTADADSEVNPRGLFGDACPLWRTHCRRV